MEVVTEMCIYLMPLEGTLNFMLCIFAIIKKKIIERKEPWAVAMEAWIPEPNLEV